MSNEEQSVTGDTNYPDTGTHVKYLQGTMTETVILLLQKVLKEASMIFINSSHSNILG